ncbi:EAL domain-containing protein [Aestuariirhabdus sp. Z084]|uniref:bifunctional diguanylate cyclase/phosphodiesterase n=1 Tax=Aestuariirhabdus haliotis TaxID=2918751 RepID=UPI00201B353F|nr:EAL domain-containing protein [Aestuariirhabdus haliotis]MCL6416162.1 EAL domain-containing protein [Aestuariirhabdus haliotis]MCL6420081.1 EAL domain-containing protein [Aestuariirhabdus haliotis]
MPVFGISRQYFITILSFVIVAGLGFYWTDLSGNLAKNEQHLLMRQLVAAQASAIERNLARSLSATDFLDLEIRRQNGKIDNFDAFASSVLESFAGVANLQLSPSGVIRQIYPLAGNEAAINHDVLSQSRYNPQAHQAVKTGELTLAGPFELVQGGSGLVGYNPVFIDQGEGKQFWGFASALLYLDDLLASTDLQTLAQKGYRYRLSRRDPITQAAVVFARTTETVDEEAFEYSIEVPNAQWQLAMSRPNGLVDGLFSFGFVVSLLAASLVASAVNQLLKQPVILRRVVAEKTRQLEELAFYDPLTGLANRRLLNEQIDLILKRMRRDGGKAALLYLDLDDFKIINDSMGHSVGDQLLARVAGRLRAVVRESDLVARLGGDEFAILLQDMRLPDSSIAVCKKLISSLRQPIMIEGKEFVVSTSIGVTLLPGDGDDVSTLLRNADLAMYDAKHAGKSRFSLFNAHMREQVLQRMMIEEELRSAIEEHQFILHLQPQVDIANSNVMGYEALIRWQHPTRGLLYPDAFIGVAEQSGMIREIGYWVMEEACRILREDPDLIGENCSIAINLSSSQFTDVELLPRITRILNDNKIDPGRFEIEITESVLMHDVDSVVDVLQEIRALGVKISVDDFGTGYSSLAYVHRFPIHTLKIDRGFIQSLSQDSNDQMIVEAIIAMAHKLQLKVVAEGVEEEKQYQRLKEFRCDFAQGYWMSRPKPLEEISGARTTIAQQLSHKNTAKK